MSTLPAVRCRDCGVDISPERLMAVPNAVRCLDCQSDLEEEPSRRIDHRCPRCGSRLMWRCRKRGTADYFIGCTAYPSCMHTE